jgi:hypothetical protein
MRNVFSDLDASRQAIGKPKDRIPVPFIDLKESRRFASPCLFKQKFVCDSVWQTALDSVGIVPTNITGKRRKDTVVEQKVLPYLQFQTPTPARFARSSASYKCGFDDDCGRNSCQTMALDAFRSQTVDGEIPSI